MVEATLSYSKSLIAVWGGCILKLPEGKTTETKTGGLEEFKGIVEKFKSDNITGYVLVKKPEEDSEITCQVVFQEGNSVLSEFISPDKTTSGTDSVIPILETIISGDVTLEVHTNIDVDLMIRFFSKAKVTSEDYDLDKKMEELKELEEKEKEKTELLKKELEERKVLEEQLQTWKRDGYVVTKLEKIFSEDLETVEEVFKEFESGVKRLTELDKELGEIESEEFKSEIENIESKLNDPDNISDIESEIKNLKQLIEEQDQKRGELRKIVEEWKNDGYNVSKLLDQIETDVGKAWDEFTTVMDIIQKLKEYEELIKNIKGKSYQDRVESIQSKIKDITALDDVKNEYSELEGLLKEESEKKERLKLMMSNWSEQGFIVDSLESVLDESFEVAEEKFIEYEKKIDLLKDIKNRLEKLDKVEFEVEIEELSKKIKDPAQAEESNTIITELEKKTEEVFNKKESLRQLLGDLKEQGYNVSELESVIDGKLETIIMKFEEFEDKKKQLDGLNKELDELDTRDFPEETEEIKSRLKDLEGIEETTNMLSDLKEKIKNNEEQRNDIKEKIMGLKEEGYDVTKLEELLEDKFSSLRDAFITFLDNINNIWK